MRFLAFSIISLLVSSMSYAGSPQPAKWHCGDRYLSFDLELQNSGKYRLSINSRLMKVCPYGYPSKCRAEEAAIKDTVSKNIAAEVSCKFSQANDTVVTCYGPADHTDGKDYRLAFSFTHEVTTFANVFSEDAESTYHFLKFELETDHPEMIQVLEEHNVHDHAFQSLNKDGELTKIQSQMVAQGVTLKELKHSASCGVVP